MEEQEVASWITFVESRDAASDGLKQKLVSRRIALRCIQEIGKQREADITVLIGKIAYLKLLHLIPNRGFVNQQHGHNYQGGTLCRDPRFKIHLGEL